MASIDLASEISKQLQTYTKDVEKKIKKAENKVTREAVEELKQKSPLKTGSYASGWGKTTVDGKTVIRNKTDGQLTHLLEFGHVKAGGGRVPARAHIRPVEEKAIAQFTDLVEKAIKP
ncbi:HK97 gp10 family phage protein [Peribacillus sp. NPDC097284]|uniref:HK97 gp10 family phage protein n=1 Tax=Peribacillus sp. NPDC097284 TaxID=3364401 RepID=UPI00380C9520